MFATRSGNVRRNSLADFENINRNGKIAMKLEEGDRIVRVAICSRGADASHGDEPNGLKALLTSGRKRCRCASDNVLLTTARPLHSLSRRGVRLFKGRDSTGVRGIGSKG